MSDPTTVLPEVPPMPEPASPIPDPVPVIEPPLSPADPVLVMATGQIEQLVGMLKDTGHTDYPMPPGVTAWLAIVAQIQRIAQTVGL